MRAFAKVGMTMLPALVFTLAGAQAQFTPPDFSAMLATNQQLAASACLAGRCGAPGRTRGASAPTASEHDVGSAVGREPSRSAGTIPLGYPASPAVRAKVVADLVERIRPKDPQGADAIKAAFAKYDYDRIYDGIAAPYGLSGNDAGSAMAAYLVLGWLIANGQQDVPGGRASALAARAQVAATLAEGGCAPREGWGELGEELKLQFVVAHAGWLHSMRERSGQPYADGIARQFQQIYGIDMRQVELGARGLQRKE